MKKKSRRRRRKRRKRRHRRERIRKVKGNEKDYWYEYGSSIANDNFLALNVLLVVGRTRMTTYQK